MNNDFITLTEKEIEQLKYVRILCGEIFDDEEIDVDYQPSIIPQKIHVLFDLLYNTFKEKESKHKIPNLSNKGFIGFKDYYCEEFVLPLISPDHRRIVDFAISNYCKFDCSPQCTDFITNVDPNMTLSNMEHVKSIMIDDQFNEFSENIKERIVKRDLTLVPKYVNDPHFTTERRDSVYVSK